MSSTNDLVGGPFSVIESDPGVFTALSRKLGIRGLELTELYTLDDQTLETLHPYGLVFCFRHSAHSKPPPELPDPDAEKIWFANQLSDDACASLALLNIVFNTDLELGRQLRGFRHDTQEMSPVMRGLAISSSHFIRNAHNSLARKADLRGSLNSLASSTLTAKKPPAKRAKKSQEAELETFHFVGYVPSMNKVWELDGLKSGPIDVGDIEAERSWITTVLPALRHNMQKHGELRFSLLALVPSAYEVKSDELLFWRKERRSIERRLADVPKLEGVDPVPFSSDFASRRMSRDVAILEMAEEQLRAAHVVSVQKIALAEVELQTELRKAESEQTEHLKRTHDYEPFFTQFIAALHEEGLYQALTSK